MQVSEQVKLSRKQAKAIRKLLARLPKNRDDVEIQARWFSNEDWLEFNKIEQNINEVVK